MAGVAVSEMTMETSIASERVTATLGMNVVRGFRRNKKTTTITRSTEIIRVLSTLATDARMVMVWSIATRMSIDWGIAALSWGSAARMPSTVSMILAFGWRKRITNMEGFPFA